VYTDLVNQGLTYKAEIECDDMEIVDCNEGMMIGFAVKENKTSKYVFLVHEYRVIEAYASENVTVAAIDKKQLNTKKARNNNLVAIKE
jgi:hypothetical protein